MNWWMAASAVGTLGFVLGVAYVPPAWLTDFAVASRFGAPMFFGVLAALVGLLVQRVRGLLDADKEAPWRAAAQWNDAAVALKLRLTVLLVVMATMGAACLVLSLVPGRAPEGYGALAGAAVIGFIFFFFYALLSWAYWYWLVSTNERDIAVESRRRQERVQQLERINRHPRDDDRHGHASGNVLTGQIVKPS